MSWVQDFPLKSSSQTVGGSSSPSNTRSLGDKFIESLVFMLSNMNTEAGIKTLLDDKIIKLPSKSSSLRDILSLYDFSKVKVALVCSIPGKFKGTAMQTVGHTGLMRALRNVGARCHADKQIALECQVNVWDTLRSSLHSDEWLVGIVDWSVQRGLD